LTVKEIRGNTGLSQAEFAIRYNIPLDTLKGWESEKGTKRYRPCPKYVEHLLELVVKYEFESKPIF